MTRLGLTRAGGRIGRAVFTALDAIGRARRAHGEGPGARAARLCAALDEIATIHALTIAVEGTWPSGPAVIVANHVSYLDPIAIASKLPCAPIGKGELAGWPLIGPAARHLGVTFVNRACTWSGARALLRAREALAAGVPVLNFPEGTTTHGDRLLPFRRGVFGLARLVGVPVVPIALRYASPDLAWVGGDHFLPHYLRTASRRAPALHIEIGAAIRPSRFASADDLALVAHRRIAHMLGDRSEHGGAVIRLRAPTARPDAVLPDSNRRAVAAR